MIGITLTNGMIALIDDDDSSLVKQYEKWHCFAGATLSTQYAYCWNPYPKALLMHRLITHCPTDKIVDHINHNGLDNQKSNLRIVTNSFNQHNRQNVKGYHYETSRGMYKATIMVDGKRMFLGRFHGEQDAREAYLIAKAQFFPTLVGAEA